MEKDWNSGEAMWNMKQAERNALDVAALNKLNEIIDVAKLRQRVQELKKERDALLEANRIACEDLVERHDRIAELKQQRDELVSALEDAVSVAKDALDHWDQDRDMKVGKLLHALSGLVKGYDRRADAVHNTIASVKDKA